TEQDRHPDQLREQSADQPRDQFSKQAGDHTGAADADSDRELDTSVFEAITLARSAALKAGVGVNAERHTPEDAEEQAPARKVSLAFELENLEGAPSLIPIEKALEEIPGVAATIVYPSATAWISANEGEDPERLIRVFERFGVSAHLTTSSLIRRSHRLAGDHSHQKRLEHSRSRGDSRRISPRVRQHARQEKTQVLRAREAGFLSRRRGSNPAGDIGVTGDVLFTARALITPLR